MRLTFKQAGSNSPTCNYSFEYDSSNKVITSSFWHEKPEESTKAYYEYFDDGRLKESYALRTIYGGAVYVDGSVYEYNGNLVFEYNYNHEEHEEKKSLYFSRFLRYDNNGRLIELSWPISVQAPWDVCDFFYE